MSRFHIEVAEPSVVLGADAPADAGAAFERVWARIPQDRPRRLWCFLPKDGLFIKGRAASLNLSRSNLMRSRRIVTEVRALRGLHDLGLPVPRVLAWGTERRCGMITRSFLVEKLVEGVVDLETYLAEGRDARRPDRRRAVLRRVGRLVRSLHDAGCVHRDLSDRNILVRFDGDEPTLHLIDCPRALTGLSSRSMPRMRRGDLFRIARSVLRDGATPAELRLVLAEAAVGDPDALVELASRSIETGRDRSLRMRRWMLTGH